MTKLSDYVFDFVRQQGVGHIFLLPGGGCMHLADSVGRTAGLEFVCNLHEQACAFGAVAYGDLRNDLGAALVTTGPGGTNALTGLAAAWIESVSLLALSGQANRSDLIGTTGVRSMGPQEVDIVSVVKPITKYAHTILNPLDIRYHLEKAVYLAKHGRRGPVWLDIPLDVQAAMIDPAALRAFDSAELSPPANNSELQSQVSRAIELLNASQRAVLFAGYGIRSSGAEEQFKTLAEALGAPVLTTWKAADLMADSHPQFAGRPGAIGQRGANFTQQNADWMLAIGARLDFAQIAFNRGNFARGARKIIVDVDSGELEKFAEHSELRIAADAKAFIAEFLRQLAKVKKVDRSAWLVRTKQWQHDYPVITRAAWDRTDVVDQYALVDVLSDELLATDIIVPGSSGPSSDIFFQSFRVKAGQKLRNFPGLGSMGTGLPGAIGACLAGGRARTICVNGDGGFQLNIQELETVRRLNVPIKFFIINNGAYASIAAMQKNHFAGRFVGANSSSGLTFPDIKRIADAYGLPAAHIANHTNLREEVRRVLSSPGPVVCEVMASAEQMVAPRVTSSVKPDGTIVSRPMEDLWPLLERDEFAKQMLIPLIEQ